MIWRLVREQLRSQWRYSAWSAGLLAFALGLATYAMVTAATGIAFQDANRASPKQHAAWFTSVFGNGEVPYLDSSEHVLPFDEVQALVAKASKEVPVEASVAGWASTEGYPEWLSLGALANPTSWNRYLASGTPPTHGQVAISDPVARELGLTIGDSITLDTIDERGPAQSMTFTISGTLKSGTVAPYWTDQQPADYAPWTDAEEIALGVPSWRQTDEATGEFTTIVSTMVTWDGDSGTLAPYDSGDDWVPNAEGFGFGRALGSTDYAGNWSLSAAGLAVLGMIVAAFGMGRAQAEARTKWAATARVLGATRRTVALSSVLETAVVSLAGIAIGLAAGVAAVAANITLLHATHPEALLPSGPSVPPILLAAGVAIGLVIAAVVSAVPAFWTSRVAPVAALKPVTPVGEAAVSRDVSVWWPVGIFGVGALAWGVLFSVYEHGERSVSGILPAFVWAAGAMVAVSAAALVVEGARKLVLAEAAVLSRSRRPWLIAAGDGLAAHRRIFTFASLATLVATAAFTWTATANATSVSDRFGTVADGGEPDLPAFDWWWSQALTGPGLAAAVAWVIAVIAIVAGVVTVSSRATFAGDAATRAALGLSANGERLASAARQWIVMGTAGVIGAVLGWLAPLVMHLVGAGLSPNQFLHSWHWNLTVASWGLAAAGLVAVVALAVALGGALAVGLLAHPRTPVEGLRQAAD